MLDQTKPQVSASCCYLWDHYGKDDGRERGVGDCVIRNECTCLFIPWCMLSGPEKRILSAKLVV